MAIMLGSFANGLFSGTQSAFQLYGMYQGVKAMARDSEAADTLASIDAMNQANASVPGGWDKDRQQPYGIQMPVIPASDGSTTDKPKDDTKTEEPGTDKGPVKKENLPAPPKPSNLTWQGMATTDAYRPQATTGVPAPPALTSAPGAGAPPANDPYRMPQTTGIGGTPFNAAGVPGQAGSPSGPPQYSATPSGPPGTSFGLSGEPQPYAPPTPWIVQQGQQLIARGQDMIRGVAAGAHATNPATMPPSQMYGGQGFGPPALPQAYTAPTTEPIPSSQPGRPVIPPEQRPSPAAPTQAPISASPYSAAGAAGGAGTQSGTAAAAPTQGSGLTVLPPGGGGEPVTGGVPQASNAPAPSLGSKIGSVFSALNPIGTAEAATRPTAGQSAAANAAQPAAPTLPPAQTEPQPAPAAGITPPAPAQAAPTAATPPTAAPPAPATAPVPVTGGKAAVAPGQTTPSTQSEPTPAVTAPPVTPDAWTKLQKEDPQLAERVKYWVDRIGGTTYEQIAAHMQRESGFNRNVGTGSYGENGIMQVWPPTQTAMEKILGHTVDAKSIDGSLELGVTYLKYLAKDKGLGENSVQTNFAYMRGDGGANYIAQHGLADAMKNPSLANALNRLKAMYPGVEFTQAMFTGGTDSKNTTPMTPEGIVTNAASGPDKLLTYISNAGPPGLGMSERWSHLQSVLEQAAILRGHYDALPHISEWVAQQSHQGALSNLAAADAALSSGNGELAAQYLAKSHAFFPDGTYARFGPDSRGNVWGEQFDEKTGLSMGKPVQLTPDMLRQQMLVLQNGGNYAKVLQEYQKNNADIALKNAQTKYYLARPDIEKSKLEGLETRQTERLQDADARQKERLADAEKRQQERQDAAAALKASQDQNTNALDKDIDTKYDLQNKPKERDQASWVEQSEVERRLRMPESMGGAHLGGPRANSIAEDLTTGKTRIDRVYPKGGKPVDVISQRAGDKIGKEITRLDPSQGEVIWNLPGIRGRNPMNPPPAAQPQPGTQGAPGAPIRTSMVVGAGAGSSTAAMQGLNQNLAGMPVQPLPQQQPQAIG